MTDREHPTIAEQIGVWVLRICLLTVPLFFWPGLYRVAHFPKHLFLGFSVFLLLACCALSRRWVLGARPAFVLPLLAYLAIVALQTLRSLNAQEGLLVLGSQLAYVGLALGAACIVAPCQVMSLLRFSVAGGAIAAHGILARVQVLATIGARRVALAIGPRATCVYFQEAPALPLRNEFEERQLEFVQLCCTVSALGIPHTLRN